MKSSKIIRQYGHGERARKTGSKREKGSKLDRKSSRGMIYENEELRLRTININAEVERGQSDIKRLRRENEQLRREIWTLRDECDRLNKRFKAKLLEHEHGCSSARGSGGSGAHRASGHGCDSNCNSDDSDSCDTCKGNDDQCSDDCCVGGSCPQLSTKQAIADEQRGSPSKMQRANNVISNHTPALTSDDESRQLHANFDHLSVVSEETLSNSELQTHAPHHQQMLGYTPDNGGSQMTIPSLSGPLTPLTPLELVANQLSDMQAVVPPLSYFENVLQQHMGSNIGSTPSSPTSKVVKHTNGWDYNLQSPFAHRKHPSQHHSPPPTSIMRTSQRNAAPQTLTTFVSTPATPTNGCHLQPDNTVSAPYKNAYTNVETVAITTMPMNVHSSSRAPSPVHQQQQNNGSSPKHFFAPLKPRLKINTSLANKSLVAASVPVLPPAVPPKSSECRNCEPPDIFVANALASPYHRQGLSNAAAAVPPPVPQRGSSSQVSRMQHLCVPQQHQQHQQHHLPSLNAPLHPHSHKCHLQQQQKQTFVTITITTPEASDAAIETDASDGAAVADDVTDAAAATTPTNKPAVLVAQPNTVLTKPSEPIYATAQKSCNKMVSAPAVTQPLMTTVIDISKHLLAMAVTPSPSPTPSMLAMRGTAVTVDSQSQTDSVNLETILNDIEAISEDILAIQLDKRTGRSGSNNNSKQNGTNKPLEQADKTSKPYRSEMNLTLQYDGANPTITSSKASVVTQTSRNGHGADDVPGNTVRCTRSLEREHTESPSPRIPAPMAPFPEKRTYIGFDQLNHVAANETVNVQKPPLPPMAGAGSVPSTPLKPPPPTPPARTYPSPLSIRCAGLARSTPVGIPQPPTGAATDRPPTPVAGLAPNKSQLYSTVAHAAAKRAQFRTAPPHMTRSLEVEPMPGNEAATADSPGANEEATRRKARRVSIVCGTEAGTPNTPDLATSPALQLRSQAQQTSVQNSPTNANSSTASNTTNANNQTSGSCLDLPSALVNPALRNLKQSTSHSTPNSPHSTRRRSITNSADCAPQSLSANASPRHAPTNSNGSCSNMTAPQQRKPSQDSTHDQQAGDTGRARCSRRHSDASNAQQRISGNSAGGGHHHHHHHHHQHQHSSSLLSNHLHHSHHSHQDSSSLSDHGSNSLASSRDSSTSFSVRSHRRKISISSHTGGKIPWCGCWGNGCL